MQNSERPLKLGIHTYTLHINGLGENWGYKDTSDFDWRTEKSITLMQLMDLAVDWGLDGLHITNVDLETLDPGHLAEVKAEAKAHDLYLEYNIARDSTYAPQVSSTIKDALLNANLMGADLVKVSLDIKRPRFLYGSCLHPDVMRQLCDRYDEIKASIPLMEELGLQLSIENHTETYADEVLWLVKQLDHPKIGTCVDTINSLVVLEGPEVCIEKMAPYANSCHFCDNQIVVDAEGTHSIGVPIGQGSYDCVKMMKTLREKSPLERITFEVEYAMGDETIESAREKELQSCIESIAYMRNVLNVGVRNR